MALTVDINPWGKAEDIHANGTVAECLKKDYLETGNMRLEELDADKAVISSNLRFYELAIQRVLGGNQWNVWKNLSVLKGISPGLDVRPHFGLGCEEAIARRNLYLPGLPKVNLTRPNQLGSLLFEDAPLNRNFMISSAPHGKEAGPYWEALQRYLAGPGKGKFYFNPASHQIRGSVPSEILERMRGRISILQTNEPEAATFARTYGGESATEQDLPDMFGAEWTAVSLGAQGLRLYVGGEKPFEMGISDDAMARRILKEKFCEEGHDVGCGDATLAALIAVKETHPNVDPKKAAEFSMEVAGVQYRHKGSNLASIYVV